ncbi:hypothetical protein M5X11_00460 [Paenibacillus alginolyticus]|nr:hypothetical protein [Paenibacillus alginolyticus]MCY9663465.1 hypothetical protein [Paenibacillus alginolyticus]
MNRSIKNKILGSVVLIVIVSLTLSSLLAYWRFFFILENQTIHDNDIYLQQTVNQMNQLVDDIEKYAGNIVNDELLQTFSNKLNHNLKSMFLPNYEIRNVFQCHRLIVMKAVTLAHSLLIFVHRCIRHYRGWRKRWQIPVTCAPWLCASMLTRRATAQGISISSGIW